MPAFSITAAHLAISLFMRSVIASGVLPRISMPSLLGTRQDLVDGPGEDLDDRAGRRSGHGNPVPTHDFKVFDTAFLDGRNGRKIGRSLSAGGSPGDDFVVRDLPAYCGIELEGDIDIATQ